MCFRESEGKAHINPFSKAVNKIKTREHAAHAVISTATDAKKKEKFRVGFVNDFFKGLFQMAMCI